MSSINNISLRFSIGSAGLACFLLFSAFMDVVTEHSGIPLTQIDFAGGKLPFCVRLFVLLCVCVFEGGKQ